MTPERKDNPMTGRGSEPAFPQIEYAVGMGHYDGRYEIQDQIPGLSKREYFAAMAMQGMWSSMGDGSYQWTHEEVAADAVIMADELLAALAKGAGDAKV